MTPAEQWQFWAEREPYFAVLTHPEYLAGNLDDDAIEAFFATGTGQAGAVVSALARRFGIDPAGAAALDFGCGVGRVTYGLSRHCRRVIGLDVAPAMLELARRHSRRAGAPTDFRLTDDFLANPEPYDLLHSTLVFQHIRPRKGLELLERLADGLAPGGCVAVQIPTASTKTRLHRTSSWLSRRLPALARARVELKRGELGAQAGAVAARAPGGPLEINIYPLGKVLAVLRSRGIERLDHATEVHGRVGFTTVYGRKAG